MFETEAGVHAHVCVCVHLCACVYACVCARVCSISKKENYCGMSSECTWNTTLFLRCLIKQNEKTSKLSGLYIS